MPFIDVNLDIVPDAQEVHPEGMTLLEITGSEIKYGKESKKPYVNWQLKVANSANTRPVYLMTSLDPDAQWNLKELCKACQYKWTPSGFNSEDLHGRQFYAEMLIEKYQGRSQNKVGSEYKPAA